jgi:hypothetical protein
MPRKLCIAMLFFTLAGVRARAAAIPLGELPLASNAQSAFLLMGAAPVPLEELPVTSNAESAFLLAGQTPALTCTPGPHCVGLSWSPSVDAAANPTLTYNAYALNAVCPATSPATVTAALAAGFVKLNTAPITSVTFTDNGNPPPLVVGNVHCDFVTAVLGIAESLPSNLVQAVILPGSPLNLSGAIR